MTNNENNDQTNQDFNEMSTLEIAVWGELFSTLGDVLSTISAVQALKEQQQQQQEQNGNNNMQQQIDDLTKEVKQLKKQMNNMRTWHL